MQLHKYLPILKKIGFAILGLLSISLITLITIPYLFKSQIKSGLQELVNTHIRGELKFNDVNISFFTHFPSLTASIQEVQLKGSLPYQDSTLLEAKEVSLGIDFMSLFSDKIVLDKFMITKGHINVLVDSTGAANYNIYVSNDSIQEDAEKEKNTNQIAFKLLQFKNIDLRYHDASIPMKIEALNLNYEGRGDLNSSVFELKTKAKIESFTFEFDKEKYVDQKSINASLITRINTDDLSFIFEKNDIIINKLPVAFKGSFAFLANGYHLDFKLKSQESTLEELLSLVPKSYASWLKDTKVKGRSEVFMNLIGDYIVEEQKMPNLSLGILVNDGYLANKEAKIPISDWQANVELNLPQLNLDSLSISLQQFEFKLGDSYFNTSGLVKGINPMYVQSSVNGSLNLGNLHQALNWPDFEIGGQFDLTGEINGTYATDTLVTGFRHKKEPYISSIPTFNIKNSLTHGYFKLHALPAAIEHIAYSLDATAPDQHLKNVKIALREVDIKALNNYIKGHADIKDLQKLHLDANVKADLNLADIKQVYPLQNIDIAGNIFVNIVSEGYMDLKKNIIPQTSASISMKNGYYKSWDYPIPLEDITIETFVNSATGSLRDLSIQVLPISFSLAGEPFFVHADFKNFNNIKYSLRSKGKLQLAPIYQMFALDGINMKGSIYTDLDLAGLQSDAMQGRYHRLKNDGNLTVKDINISTELLPKPIQINKGKFSFKQEKLHIDQFTVQYGRNKLSIQGTIANIISYLTRGTDILKGNIELQSQRLHVDDFMAFADDNHSTASTTASNGVVLLPYDVDMNILAKVDQVFYNQMKLNNFNGQLQLHAGTLSMENTGFELAGITTNMNSNYRPLTPLKAKFDFNVKADNFNIQRAYKEIPLFQEMVSSAKYAEGTVSLDYQLGGLLNAEMSPILSSIQGKGTLTLDQIKFRNFKLLQDIGNKTGKDGLAGSSVKKVKINSSIKNNVMTIEQTKMKMASFRSRFEGQVTLDGKMNLGFRLGLPPWGILGIPMRITGNADNFKIKLGKYKEDQLDTDMDEEDKALYEASLRQDSLKNNIQ